jgi:hypothetical protein
MGIGDKGRLICGSYIPRWTDEEVKKFFLLQDDPVFLDASKGARWVLPLVSDDVDSFGAKGTRNGKDYSVYSHYLTRELTKRYGQGTWYQLLERACSIPNGQVKNFLVACRTLSPPKSDVRVVLKGSKASQGGGIWHKYYACYLALFHSKVEIDAFDVCEIDEVSQLTFNGSSIFIRSMSRFYEGDGSEYDVIVDDAYLRGVGVVPMIPKCPNWSLKVHVPDAIPFLHVTESRDFSHKPREFYRSDCECMVCRVSAQCVDTCEQFTWLRGLTAVMGHRLCEGSVVTKDVEAKHVMLRRILMEAQVEMVRGSDHRAVLSLREEINVVPVAANIVKYASGPPTDHFHVHKKGFLNTIETEQARYPWLEGKRVMFVGVTSAILGATRVHRGTGYVTDMDSVFCGSIEAALQSQVCRSLYVIITPKEVPVKFPGWVLTGKAVSSFREIVPSFDRPLIVSHDEGGSGVHPVEYSRISSVTLVAQPFHVYERRGVSEFIPFPGRFRYLYEFDSRVSRVTSRVRSSRIRDSMYVVGYSKVGDVVRSDVMLTPEDFSDMKFFLREWRSVEGSVMYWMKYDEIPVLRSLLESPRLLLSLIEAEKRYGVQFQSLFEIAWECPFFNFRPSVKKKSRLIVLSYERGLIVTPWKNPLSESDFDLRSGSDYDDTPRAVRGVKDDGLGGFNPFGNAQTSGVDETTWDCGVKSERYWDVMRLLKVTPFLVDLEDETMETLSGLEWRHLFEYQQSMFRKMGYGAWLAAGGTVGDL